jgi:polysaccharide biosynthesis transport protein
MVPTEVAPTGNSFRRLGLAARRQWWVVLGCVLLAAVGSVGYVKTRVVSYSASAAVSLASPFTPSSSSSGASSSSGTESSTSSSQISAALLTGPLSPATEIAKPGVVSAAATAAQLPEYEVVLSAVPVNNVVSITAKARTAEQAAAMANGAAQAFVKQRLQDVRDAIASLNPQLDALSKEITRLQATVKEAGATTASAAQAELSVTDSQYQSLYAQQQQISLAGSSVSLSSKASASEAYTGGGGKRVAEVAVVAGLLVGLGIALAREQFDDKIRSNSELSEIGKFDVLAELPVANLRRGSTIADKPSGEMAEAIRELRTALRFLSVKRPIRTLLVASAAPGEGKSFVAANIAAAFAMSGVRTILVSSDLRRPGIERIFGLERSGRGLSDAIVDAALLGHDRTLSEYLAEADGETQGLKGSSTGTDDPVRNIDDLLVETKVDGLKVLPAGISPPNPAELLGSPEFGKILLSLRERAEVLVLDSPPALAVTDALVLTAQVDGVLFVVSQNGSSRGEARRALRQLSGGLAPVLGVVVNRSSRVAPYLQ